jgi:hypothetical protein
MPTASQPTSAAAAGMHARLRLGCSCQLPVAVQGPLPLADRWPKPEPDMPPSLSRGPLIIVSVFQCVQCNVGNLALRLGLDTAYLSGEKKEGG